MFSISFGGSRKRAEPTRQDQEVLGRIETILGRVPRRGLIDPLNVALQAKIDGLAAVGYLEMLKQSGRGQFVVRVITRDGDELQRFPDVRSIPGRLTTEFGEELDVLPENIDIAFDPHYREHRSTSQSATVAR